VDRASDRRWGRRITLWGSCSEVVLSLPYLPFLEAIVNHLVGAERSIRHSGAWAYVLASSHQVIHHFGSAYRTFAQWYLSKGDGSASAHAEAFAAAQDQKIRSGQS
jgi:hypothetical protein